MLRLILLLMASVLPVVSQAAVSNTSVWNGLFVTGRISDQWGYFLEQQLRLNDAPELESILLRGNRWLVRPALVWRSVEVPGLQLFFGAAHTPNLSPVRGEFRLWQQAQYSDSSGRLYRLRLEQRGIENAEGLSNRARLMVRSTGSRLAVWDEVFWTVNSVAGGPRAGFDQNRFFVGPLFQLDQASRLEVGYLQSWIARGAASDSQVNHSAVIYVFFATEQRSP